MESVYVTGPLPSNPPSPQRGFGATSPQPSNLRTFESAFAATRLRRDKPSTFEPSHPRTSPLAPSHLRALYPFGYTGARDIRILVVRQRAAEHLDRAATWPLDGGGGPRSHSRAARLCRRGRAAELSDGHCRPAR